jgi:predicted TIM-barrel fold metal-dependent hydrolase
MVPRDYAKWLNDKGITAAGGRALPDWNPAAATELMDRQGIATGVLSVSAPGTHLGDAAEAETWARRVNEFGAELVRAHPDRFGLFATLALPDTARSISLARQALDELRADGVILLANTLGTYLGNPSHDPLLAELDARAAIVFVHPNELPGPGVPGIPAFAADFLLDTTRAATNLVLHDVPRRFPRIRFILAHAGGFLPYAAHRIALAITGETGSDPNQVLNDLSTFYFDTALSASPASLAALLAFARPDHILFGSDFPFAPDFVVAYFNRFLDTYPALEATGINRANAAALFPRLS